MFSALLTPHSLALCAACLALGWCAGRGLGGGWGAGDCAPYGGGDDELRSEPGQVKMVLCVRTDLQMTKGKIAAQCGHASLGMYMKLQNREPTLLQNWFASGQPKIALKVESEADMLSLRSAATALQLPVHVVVDAGKTQLAPNTRTVLAILGPKESLDAVSGVLKLL